MAIEFEDVGDAVFAMVASSVAAVFAALLGIIAAMFFGYFLLRIGFYTEEASA